MKMKDNYNDIYELCKNHMHAYVMAEVVDGSKFDGIVTGLDDEYVYFAIPMDNDQELPQVERGPGGDDRPFGYGHHGYGYGYGYPGYGYGGGPRPRFRRLILPLTALAALSVLPWY